MTGDDAKHPPGDPGHPTDDGLWSGVVDHALGQTGPDAREEHRAEMDVDPHRVLATAEVRDLLERCRELTVEVPAEVGLRQRILQQELQRRHRLRTGRHTDRPVMRWVDVAATLAVAAALLLAMVLWQGTRGDAGKPGGAPRHGAGMGPLAQGTDAGERRDGGDGRASALPGGTPLPELPESTEPQHGARPIAEPDLLAIAEEEEVDADDSDGSRVADPYAGWVDAHNDMARMRAGYDNRRDSAWRREVIARHGGNPDMEWRVRSLARALSLKIRGRLGPGSEPTAEPSVRDVALALRGLTAAGHAPGFGEHGDEAALCLHWLEATLAADAEATRAWAADPRSPRGRALLGRMLDGEQRTMALAALAEVAALRGGRLAELVQQELTDLCAMVVAEGGDGSRPPLPGLLHLTTSTAALGEAGRLFGMAPAFGCDPVLAEAARRKAGGWLLAEIAAGRRSGPAVLAAQLYGYDELVDRSTVDQELRLWRARWLLPDYTALHHMAWSRFPVRAGFADFQLLLRQVSGFATPEDVGDTGTLLLCLAANFAAPGAAPL